jgi:hypothetical protein
MLQVCCGNTLVAMLLLLVHSFYTVGSSIYMLTRYFANFITRYNKITKVFSSAFRSSGWASAGSVASKSPTFCDQLSTVCPLCQRKLLGSRVSLGVSAWRPWLPVDSCRRKQSIDTSQAKVNGTRAKQGKTSCHHHCSGKHTYSFLNSMTGLLYTTRMEAHCLFLHCSSLALALRDKTATSCTCISSQVQHANRRIEH